MTTASLYCSYIKGNFVINMKITWPTSYMFTFHSFLDSVQLRATGLMLCIPYRDKTKLLVLSCITKSHPITEQSLEVARGQIYLTWQSDLPHFVVILHVVETGPDVNSWWLCMSKPSCHNWPEPCNSPLLPTGDSKNEEEANLGHTWSQGQHLIAKLTLTSEVGGTSFSNENTKLV